MIGENIKKLRNAKNLTQIELAELLHVRQTTISSWERDRTEPNMGMVEALASALGCYKSDIIGEQYYISHSAADMARAIQENPDLLALFDAAQDAAQEDLQAARAVLVAMKGKMKK